MSVTVTRIPNEPILVATIEGDVDLSTIQDLFAQSRELMKDMQGHVYRITDTRKAGVTFSELRDIVREAATRTEGSSTDPNVTPVFVGNQQMLRMTSGLMRQQQFGGIQIPIFGSIEEALEHIRTLIDGKQTK